MIKNRERRPPHPKLEGTSVVLQNLVPALQDSTWHPRLHGSRLRDSSLPWARAPELPPLNIGPQPSHPALGRPCIPLKPALDTTLPVPCSLPQPTGPLLVLSALFWFSLISLYPPLIPAHSSCVTPKAQLLICPISASLPGKRSFRRWPRRVF